MGLQIKHDGFRFICRRDNAKNFDLPLPRPRTFQVVGCDAGFLAAPVPVTRGLEFRLAELMLPCNAARERHIPSTRMVYGW